MTQRERLTLEMILLQIWNFISGLTAAGSNVTLAGTVGSGAQSPTQSDGTSIKDNT